MLTIAVAVICYGFPWFPIILVPALCLYFLFQRFYRRASREAKRIESIAKSPIFSHFSDSLKVSSFALAIVRISHYAKCPSSVSSLITL